jgi:hypothetical protein
MEVFREMYLRGEPDKLAETMDEIERRLTTGWTRDRDAEESLMSVGVEYGDTYCYIFRTVEGGHLPIASLFISEMDREPGVLHVSNISPREVGQLSIGEYNAILEDFHERFARPSAQTMGVTIELTEEEADLRRWLSEAAAIKLRTFCKLANRGTGGAHPLDRNRWLDFVVSAHREGSRLEAATLRRWLIEVEGWYPEVADRLAGEYEFSGEVLTFSNSEIVRAER